MSTFNWKKAYISSLLVCYLYTLLYIVIITYNLTITYVFLAMNVSFQFTPYDCPLFSPLFAATPLTCIPKKKTV